MAKKTVIDPAGVKLAIEMLEDLQALPTARQRTVDEHRGHVAKVMAKARTAGEPAFNALLGILCDVIARAHVGELPTAAAYRGLLEVSHG